MAREFRNVCAIEGCDKGAYNEVCNSHAKKIRSGFLPEQFGVKHNPPCEYEGCDDPKYTKKATYCRFHYECSLAGVDPKSVRPKRKNSRLTNETCLASECEAETRAMGLCWKHYQETRPGYVKPEPRYVECSVEGCPRNCDKERGTCSIHLNQIRVHGVTWNGPMPYELTNEFRQAQKVNCAVAECNKRQSSLESILCSSHLARAAKMTKGDQKLYVELKARSTCDICGDSDSRLVFDHDHSCCPPGRACDECIRGVLCNGCNSILGHSRDSKETLYRAIQYLDRWGELGG